MFFATFRFCRLLHHIHRPIVKSAIMPSATAMAMPTLAPEFKPGGSGGPFGLSDVAVLVVGVEVGRAVPLQVVSCRTLARAVHLSVVAPSPATWPTLRSNQQGTLVVTFRRTSVDALSGSASCSCTGAQSVAATRSDEEEPAARTYSAWGRR